MITETLTCRYCNDPIVDDEVWDQDDNGQAYHPSCEELSAETTWDRPMAEHEAEYRELAALELAAAGADTYARSMDRED